MKKSCKNLALFRNDGPYAPENASGTRRQITENVRDPLDVNEKESANWSIVFVILHNRSEIRLRM